MAPRLSRTSSPAPGVSDPEDIVSAAPRTTFFRAWDKKHGEELRKIDGTEKGTKIVKDSNPDLPPGARCDQGECGIPEGWSHPDTVTVMGKQVFFAADDGKTRCRAVEERRYRERYHAGQGHQHRQGQLQPQR